MSSRFVSSGAIDTETGDAVPLEDPSTSSASTATNNTNKSQEWAAVQAQLEADRLQRQKAREEASSQAAGGGSSLYDVLQANKAAKQAAFEEANKIKNQFRPLDDDEIEFLDEVRSRRRQEEERLRKETEEGLKGFRERQKLSEKESPAEDAGQDAAAGAAEDGAGGGEWNVGRKRKRRKDDHFDGIIKGLKRAGSSNAGHGGKEKAGAEKSTATGEATTAHPEPQKSATDTPKTTAAPAEKPKLSLVEYGSDDDSD